MDIGQYSISDVESNILVSQENIYVVVATIAVIGYDSSMFYIHFIMNIDS